MQLFAQIFTEPSGQLPLVATKISLPHFMPLETSSQLNVVAPVSAFPPKLDTSPKNSIMFNPTINTITKPISITLFSSSKTMCINKAKGLNLSFLLSLKFIYIRISLFYMYSAQNPLGQTPQQEPQFQPKNTDLISKFEDKLAKEWFERGQAHPNILYGGKKPLTPTPDLPQIPYTGIGSLDNVLTHVKQSLTEQARRYDVITIQGNLLTYIYEQHPDALTKALENTGLTVSNIEVIFNPPMPNDIKDCRRLMDAQCAVLTRIYEQNKDILLETIDQIGLSENDTKKLSESFTA